VQTTGVPVHTPDWQVYVLHLSLPVQDVPSLFGVEVQPRTGSHEATWHWSAGGQVIGVLMQLPVFLSHVSVVQALLSSQFFGVWTHVPLEHVSIVHGLPSSQSAGLLQQLGIGRRPQTPLTQVAVLHFAPGQSAAVQHWALALQVPLQQTPDPALHVVPFGLLEQTPLLHV
jgi:hypothetical protein